MTTTDINAANPWRAFEGSGSSWGELGEVLALADFEKLAQARLPRPIFGYVSGAAETNATLDDNRRAFSEWGFVPRVLRNVAQRSQRVRLLGQDFSSPFGIAPMGIAGLSAFQGDLVLARSAACAGIPFILSGTSLLPLETVMKQAPESWFQAYLPGDPARIDALIARVESAAVKTLVITVDIPVAGNRENNIRAGFSTPLRPTLKLALDGLRCPRWLVGTMLRTLLTQGMPHFENSFAERGAPILSANIQRDFSQRDHFEWSHIERIRARWQGRLVVKGILSPQDADLARRLSVDGIIVSNHGGRQLDGAVSSLRVLPSIVRSAGDMVVMIDGGVRRGSDVLKALALGAKFVFVGRPFNFAAAVGGDAGVMHAIRLLRDEVDRNMAMLGTNSLEEMCVEHLLNLRSESFSGGAKKEL